MQKGAYDKAARPLNSLIVGENVLFDRFDPLKKKAIWDHGVITDVCEKCRRWYMVRVSNGTECGEPGYTSNHQVYLLLTTL